MKLIRKSRKYFITALILFGGAFLILFSWGRSIQFENRFAPIVFSQEGEIMSARVSKDQQWRMKCEEELPFKLKTAIRLFEDQYFEYHPGINPVSLIKALRQNIKAGRIVRGGSTLTMQLARIHYGNRKRTYWQKTKEIALALALETSYSKTEIMQLYGQYAPFGGNTIGYCAASWRYYNKPSALLSWGEAATLAVLPNAPSDIFPGKGQKKLLKKKNLLLQKLLAENYMDSVSYRLIKRESIPTQSNRFPTLTPHLLTYFTQKQGLKSNYHTTIDYSLQKRVHEILSSRSDRYQNIGIDNMAVLVLRNDGTVASYVANSNCLNKNCGGDVDIIRSPRSPGSALKPFLYGACLDAGIISEASWIADVPSFYNGFNPRNYDKRFRGVVPAKDALTQSLNVPAVNLLNAYGIESFLHDLRDMRFDYTNKTGAHYGLSLILGGSEITMMELGRAYMNLVRKSIFKEPLEIHLIKDRLPKQISTSFPISSGASWIVLEMLKGVNRPIGEVGWQYFSTPQPISWKTGTSYGFRDAWSVGVTKDYTVVVWVGNADGEGRKGLTGIDKAAPLLFDVFNLLPNSKPIQTPYNDLKTKNLCSISGYSMIEACKLSKNYLLPNDAHHIPLCKYHKWATVDVNGARTNSSCDDWKDASLQSFVVLDPVHNNYYRKYSGNDLSLPPMSKNCDETEDHISIVYPTKNADILLPRDIDDKVEELVLIASVNKGVDTLFWFLDDKYIGITNSIPKMKMKIEKGHHVLAIVAPSGERAVSHFKIR